MICNFNMLINHTLAYRCLLAVQRQNQQENFTAFFIHRVSAELWLACGYFYWSRCSAVYGHLVFIFMLYLCCINVCMLLYVACMFGLDSDWFCSVEPLVSTHHVHHLAPILSLKLDLKDQLQSFISYMRTCCFLCEENINRTLPLLLWFNGYVIEWLELKNL